MLNIRQIPSGRVVYRPSSKEAVRVCISRRKRKSDQDITLCFKCETVLTDQKCLRHHNRSIITGWECIDCFEKEMSLKKACIVCFKDKCTCGNS